MKETPQEIIFKSWNSLPANYSNARRLAFGILTLFEIFGSTYNSEQCFSTMNYIKNKHRSRLTDASLKTEMLLKWTKYTPNLTKLANKIQVQKSH